MNSFKKITAVFLASVFLFSSMGFTISSMVCLESGKGKVSLSVLKDCCEKGKKQLPASGTFLSKGHCCKISNLFIKLNEFSSSKKFSVEQAAAQDLFFIPAGTAFNIASAQKLSYRFTDLPPPYHGRTLLNFISTLRV
jgi:hypothetical protein